MARAELNFKFATYHFYGRQFASRSVFSKGLGIDSLGLAELICRIERKCWANCGLALKGIFRGKYWLVLLAVAMTPISGCTDRSHPSNIGAPGQPNQSLEERIKEWPPILDHTGSRLQLLSGSTPESLSSSTAVKVVAGEEYWSGMSTVKVSGRHPITIEEASVMTSSGVKQVGVFIGRRGIDGLPGSTARKPPGHDKEEFAGKTLLPAAGTVLQPGGPEMVIYAVASLDKDVAIGSIYGTSLTIRDGDHLSEVMLLFPTILCTVNTTELPESQPCQDYHWKLLETIAEVLS